MYRHALAWALGAKSRVQRVGHLRKAHVVMLCYLGYIQEKFPAKEWSADEIPHRISLSSCPTGLAAHLRSRVGIQGVRGRICATRSPFAWKYLT